MTDFAKNFCINAYSYTLDHTALDCVRKLGEQGYGGVELMMYPGHLWPASLDAAGRRELRQAGERGGVRFISVNMPNIDLNIAGASDEVRAYTIKLLSGFVEFAGEMGVPFVVLGPGKANPLFSMPRPQLIGHLKAGLDVLYPLAKKGGTKLLLENMPFGFLPSAQEIVDFIDDYGNQDIGVIYDVANGHFISKDPREELRLLKGRVEVVHFSDTGRQVYKHDPVGTGDVPFAAVAPVLPEIGYGELPVLEVISRNPDADIRDSARRLADLGYGAAAKAA